MNFVYFIPGENRQMLTPDQLPGSLKETLSGCALECRKTSKGPSGSAGLLLTAELADAEGRKAPTEHDPETQIWDDQGAFWIGGVKGDLPAPVDLRRAGKPIDGHLMTLADGNEWLIPVVGPFSSRLPRVFRMKKGAPTLETSERYQELAAESEGYAEWCAGNGTKPWIEVMAFIAKCLGLNYHVGLEEVSALGILDTQNGMNVIEAIVGVIDYREMEQLKKTA